MYYKREKNYYDSFAWVGPRDKDIYSFFIFDGLMAEILLFNSFSLSLFTFFNFFYGLYRFFDIYYLDPY